MKANYDFSKAEQGKFYNPDAVFEFPIYLESDVNKIMTELAQEKGVDVETLVNELLREQLEKFNKMC